MVAENLTKDSGAAPVVKVTLTIDGQKVTVPKGTTIMNAADIEVGIHIPRLCYSARLSPEGACRICIVKVEGRDGFVSSCVTEAEEGMVVTTDSPAISHMRRDIVELLLDNHPRECHICERNGHCELQGLAYSQGVRERRFEGERKIHPIEDNNHAIVRFSEKCILCKRCVRVCRDIQGVYNLDQHYRGFNTVVKPAYDDPLDASVCVQCGQCTNVCPTAALQEKSHVDRVLNALQDPSKLVIVQTAPSVRAAIGEEFVGLGIPSVGKMVSCLRKIGFAVVFDTNFGADLTIMEEANELVRRIKSGGPLPLLTSCSAGWINYLEKFYPEAIKYASTCRSPMSMLSAITKTYYVKKINRDPKDIFMVAVMPCVAKKHEIARPEHRLGDIQLTDAVLTTRELVWMIKSHGIDFDRQPDGDFDSPLGESTGAGVIFGTTGGVMEAALRTAAHIITNGESKKIEFEEVRAVEGLRERTITIGDLTLRIGVANGLINASKLLDDAFSTDKQYHAIELMACPGGCIGGGGQPYPLPGYQILDPEILDKRRKALYFIDKVKKVRVSHENESIKTLYKEFLGEPGGEMSHKLLHTSYAPKTPRGIRIKEK